MTGDTVRFEVLRAGEKPACHAAGFRRVPDTPVGHTKLVQRKPFRPLTNKAKYAIFGTEFQVELESQGPTDAPWDEVDGRFPKAAAPGFE